jgi:NAD(P)-dependent dehydrogenase (short-subunit alcohol dehydrogenase family)
VTKWGLTGLMKSLALELGPEGIAVNAVARGRRDGPAHIGRRRASNAGWRVRLAGHTLPSQLLEPREIATAIAFLAGPGSGIVSGTTVDVNAGRSAQLSA